MDRITLLMGLKFVTPTFPTRVTCFAQCFASQIKATLSFNVFPNENETHFKFCLSIVGKLGGLKSTLFSHQTVTGETRNVEKKTEKIVFDCRHCACLKLPCRYISTIPFLADV